MNLSIEAFCEFLAQSHEPSFPAGSTAWSEDAICAFIRSQGHARPRVFADLVGYDAGNDDWVHRDLEPDHWIRTFLVETRALSTITRHAAHGIASRIRAEAAS